MADFLIGGQIDPASHQRTGTPTAVASSDLTTHGVIVGMTGSGKTGLGIVLIEDALRAGIPTLVVDPKGDLTNLCLMFANLAAADFEPWVNEGDASKAGMSVAAFAQAQAKLWTDGLAEWSLGPTDIAALREAVEFTIYTPGSNAGVGINIVGSLQAPDDVEDAEIVGDEIDGFVGGLLGLVGIDADPLSSREHILLSNLILNEWTNGRTLDLAALIAMVQKPPMRKLGVFELDTFFPPKERTAFAIRLNGLLASPSFASWMAGPPLDIASMLWTPDGKPRCAIVTTAHLSEEERQFATTLVLTKLITWMRRQSGTTDLRAMLYMDEVAGYLPPTAMPPTKKPIMTLMKQARAFGVGVVLATQNPVDVDYKALSNAGTWMIGRLQTERDKSRLLAGMSAASGGVDVDAVGATIGGLAKREFVLRRAGKDQPEVFATRWAMSYLRGPLTREQIATLMNAQKEAMLPLSPVGPSTPSTPSASPAADETAVMPAVAEGIGVRWADPASPWLVAAGGDPAGAIQQAAVVARVVLRYDDSRADIVHDDEYELVLTALTEAVDVTRAVGVDYDERDLLTEPPTERTYRLTDKHLRAKSWWSRLERDIVDHLARSRSLEIAVNRDLKLYGRPGETIEAFAIRCYGAADVRADAETAALRDKYHDKLARLRSRLQAAQDRANVLGSEQQGRINEEIMSTAGSILGDLLRSRRSRGGLLGSVLGKAGSAAGRRSRSNSAEARVDAAEHKVRDIVVEMDELEAELSADVFEIDTRWNEVSKRITTIPIALERTDVRVVQLLLAWIPMSVPHDSTGLEPHVPA